jgi:hypothetical protein
MHHSAQRHIPEDCKLHIHLRADRKAIMKNAILLLQKIALLSNVDMWA